MAQFEPLCRSEEELDYFDQVSWWIEGIIQLIICIIGMFANLVAIPILLSKPLANIFNRFV